ncbi:unnamed protein product [Microthlaspi erraticum]|uniref:RING-type domain-containing protein n=1 Tax=Microthlaspi erraticum TaxID=1685480 RepID=A0A6D2I394_9BRAS|nr:unnamed protein product [Microthlaspi erraticum]
MEETIVKSNLTTTADPIFFSATHAGLTISVKLRIFRQTVHLPSSGRKYLTIREHRLVSPPQRVGGDFFITPGGVLPDQDIELELRNSGMDLESWVGERVVGVISPQVAECLKINRALQNYMIEGDVDVIFETSVSDSQGLITSVLADDETNTEVCSICFGELSGGNSCVEIQCSHRFHKDCLWGWLRNKTSCPNCRRCLCGETECQCLQPAGI